MMWDDLLKLIVLKSESIMLVALLVRTWWGLTLVTITELSLFLFGIKYQLNNVLILNIKYQLNDILISHNNIVHVSNQAQRGTSLSSKGM